MGLFRRKKDADDFYRGDAPVSAPGFDGEAPGAYQQGSGSTVSAADMNPASWMSAPGSPAGSQAGYQPGYPADPQQQDPQQSFQQPQYQQPGPHVVQAAPGSPLADIVAEAYRLADARPERASDRLVNAQVERDAQRIAATPRGQQFATGAGLDPATAARVQAALARGAKGSKLGCLIIAIPIIGALVAAGVGIFAAVKGSNAAQDAISGIVTAQGASAAGPGTSYVDLGQPVSITAGEASYRITVYGAELQQGDGWGYDGPGAAPALVVGAEIARTDAGRDPIEFTGWNWSVTGDDGNAVTGDIISHFAPSLDGPELAGGESMRGFVSFATSVTDTELTVAAGPFDTPLATWHLTASTPRVVTGEIGTPAQGEISRPGFTVTAGQPEVVTADDERVGTRPASGQYLVVPVTFTGIEYMEGSIGNVDKSRLVFVSADAKKTDAPLESTFSGLDGASSFFPVSADAPTSGVLAFDTASVKGELQLRGEADQPIITWQIAAG